MVFFICEACGETLKKNKVDAHSWGCRNCWAFACMDCGVRFEGEAYKEHMSCMSEAQKYQGKLYQSKENKGEVKQRSWIEGVQQRLASASSDSQLRPYAEQLLAYENLPRKKAKFINFAKNSLNLKADRDGIAEKLWLLVEAPAAEEVCPVVPADEAPAAAAAAPAAAPAAAAPAAAAPAAAPATTQNASKPRKGEGGVVVVPPSEADKLAAMEKLAAKKEKKEKKKEKTAAAPATEAPAAAAEKSKGGSDTTDTAHVGKKRKKGDEDGGGAGGSSKPVKWKKIISKELESEGGSMKLKELRSAAVKEALAHPSHTGREEKDLRADFDAAFGTFTGIKGKFVLDGKLVRLATPAAPAAAS